MIARVVTRRDDARIALAASAVSAFGLGTAVLDDLDTGRSFGPPMVVTFACVAMAIALGGIAPWLARPRRGRAMAVRCEPGVVRVGGEMNIEAGDVTALVVADAVGYSVGVARGSGLVFLEVERPRDARRIAEALKAPATPCGLLPLRRRSRLLVVLQAFVAAVAMTLGPLYFLSAMTTFDPWWVPINGKAFFGIGGIITSWTGMALLIARRLLPEEAMAFQRGAWEKNDGIRIDHHLLSPQAADLLIEAGIDKAVRGRDKPSDHVPVWIELDA